MSDDNPTAALLIIGNEILSGRTQEANLNVLAKKLGAIGVPLKEARVIPDIRADIIGAVNDLRKRTTYVFTTGGIGPTHDDITIDSVAAAFGLSVREHPEARALLAAHFGEENLTAARLRMARAPIGATLIDNPVSVVPGVKIENVYMLAGVPEIMESMLDSVVLSLRHGPKMYTLTVSGFIAESVIADELRTLAERFPHVDIGSYPWVRKEKFGAALVVRGTDSEAVRRAAEEIVALVEKRGIKTTLSGA
jgi:molybdopterin-biosynthesis enzyme MoeA-like protein